MNQVVDRIVWMAVLLAAIVAWVGADGWRAWLFAFVWWAAAWKLVWPDWADEWL